MRRAGGLWPEVVAFGSLRRAALRAARGKRGGAIAARFLLELEPELFRLQRELVDGSYRPRRASSFEIHDPKCRTITAVPFRDRVVQHALIAPLEPTFERRMIAHSYACRREKGSVRALRSAQRYVRRFAYALKLDVARFFPSLRLRVVEETLARVVKDRAVLALAATILRGSPEEPARERGLPIGSLTSQWFANLVLDRLDHYVLETLRVPAYLRYMDDFVVFADAKEELHLAHSAIASFLRDELDLELKARATRLAPTHAGLPFLGLVVFPRLLRLQPAKLRRTRWRLRFLRYAFARGAIDAERYRRATGALAAHLALAHTRSLRRKLFAEDTRAL